MRKLVNSLVGKAASLPGRMLVMLTMLMVGIAALAQEETTYTDYGPVVDNQVFADLGTYIFGVLVAAVVAGLGLLVARVGVKRIWTFIRSFF